MIMDEVENKSAAAAAATSVDVDAVEVKEEKKVQTDLGKCWHCNKKVVLVRVPCKCSYVFCPKHRHAEAHNCSFDYVKAH